MEEGLYNAAREGAVSTLLKLLEDDPLLLDRSYAFGTYAESPLHIAAMLGHLDFAREILSRKPSLAKERNKHGSTPLHLATATNNINLVTLLLDNDLQMCVALDLFGRNPVHIAAIRGRVEILKRLLHVAHDAARVPTKQGDSILHLCVKYNQLEALKVLVEDIDDYEFVNSRDPDGNTVLHLAVLEKQFEAVSFLLDSSKIDVNTVNCDNQTALDILYMKDKNMIAKALVGAGAMSSSSINPSFPLPQRSGDKQSYFKNKILENQEAVMIAASLIAAAAFQVGVNPPGGVWQDSVEENKAKNITKHMAGFSIAAYRDSPLYSRFVVENTIAFVASLFVFLLLLTRLHYKNKFFTGAYMVAIWVAIVAIAASFFSSLLTVAPPGAQYDKVSAIANAGMVVSVILWVLIILWYLGGGPWVIRKICRSQQRTKPSISSPPLFSAPTLQTV